MRIEGSYKSDDSKYFSRIRKTLKMKLLGSDDMKDPDPNLIHKIRDKKGTLLKKFNFVETANVGLKIKLYPAAQWKS